MTENQQEFMAKAIQLALENAKSASGGPFGAVVVRDGQVVGSGVNRVTSTNDPTAHAEVVAIRAACATLGTFDLSDCAIYSSCEPCPMCLGAIYWARLQKAYYACIAEDAANAGFSDAFIYREIAKPLPHRDIPFVQMMRDEALVVFRTWLENPNRVNY